MGEAGLSTLWLDGAWGWAVRSALLAFFLVALLAFAKPAAAALSFCPPGSGAGQCSNPEGLATDFETEHLYVADRGNHRINVFEADGEFLFSFGEAQLSSPEFVAVDNVEGSAARHDIYVTDAGKVCRFEEDGTFVTCFEGGGECHLLSGSIFLPVAVGPGGNVFVAATEGIEPNFTARVEEFSPAGECLGETVLLTGNHRLRALAVDANEDAYATDERAGGWVRKYDLATPETELCSLDPGIETKALAMDEAGHLFAAQREGRDKGGPDFQVITEYDVSSCPPTKQLRRFGYEEIANNVKGLAALHTAEGDVFASEGGANPVKYLKYPQPGPIAPPASLELTRIGSANADVGAEINPEGKETKFHFEYVTQAQFEETGFTAAKSTEEQTLSQAAGAFRVNAAASLLGCPVADEDPIKEGKCLAPETVYRWQVVSSNADGEGLGTAEGPPFETKGPIEIEDLWAMEVGTDAAVLGAIVNPVGSPTKGHFEYVTDAQFNASGFDEAVKAPAGEAELDFGKGETGVKRTATIFPLTPGTTYHYRVAAGNPALKNFFGLDFIFSDPETFTTFEAAGEIPPCPNDPFRLGAAALLPDCRAYELVSPLDKENSDIKLLPEFISAQPAVVNQSATSGDRLAYGSLRAFADPDSAPYTSQYIADRDPKKGWLTHAINPPQDGSIKGSIVFDEEYRAFSEDLCEGWMTAFFEPPLAEDAIAGYFNLYRRTDQLCGGEKWEAITTAKPLTLGLPQKGSNLYLIEPQGHSADGSVNAFAANDSLAGTAAPAQPPLSSCKTNGAECKKRLYVQGEGKLSFACILPTGVPVGGSENCTAGSFNNPARLGTTRSPNVRGALSEDGKRLFWSRWTEDVNPHGPIYLRENPLASGANCSGPSAPCTKDVSKGGEIASGTPGSGAHFWQGALDGSAALYTTGGTIGGDLYRYLTAINTSEPIAGEVLGLVGASDEVQSVYFGSKEVLTGEKENELGQKAEAGEANLYLQEAGEGGGYRFIGRLAESGQETFLNPEPVSHNGRVSPDGLHAAFMSAAPMTGYDNTDAKSGEADTEVFVYDATANGGAGELICASCNPTGGRPSGKNVAAQGPPFWAAGRIPASYSTLAEPEVLAPDGQRLIFEATDALVPRDTNGRIDVYEWERAGQGSCKESDTTFSAAANGCVDLISSGQSLVDSEIVDVSPSGAGADVFFNTLESLVPQDYGLRDVYDARIGGGFEPPLPPRPKCQGESCQNPPPAPEFGDGASEANLGPGNVTQKKPKGCPKGKHKVKKNGKSRCVPNKKKGSNKAKGKRQRGAAG